MQRDTSTSPFNIITEITNIYRNRITNFKLKCQYEIIKAAEKNNKYQNIELL